MRVRKDEEIKARVDGRTKAELGQLAFIRGLDVSDLLRQAVRDLLSRERQTAGR
jgi:hypothetical protein